VPLIFGPEASFELEAFGDSASQFGRSAAMFRAPSRTRAAHIVSLGAIGIGYRFAKAPPARKHRAQDGRNDRPIVVRRKRSVCAEEIHGCLCENASHAADLCPRARVNSREIENPAGEDHRPSLIP
jgi:hypothetical protein